MNHLRHSMRLIYTRHMLHNKLSPEKLKLTPAQLPGNILAEDVQ